MMTLGLWWGVGGWKLGLWAHSICGSVVAAIAGGLGERDRCGRELALIDDGRGELMADEEKVIQELVGAAQEAESAQELADDEALRARAEAVFGRWDVALAASLIEAVPRGGTRARRPQEAKVERRVTEAFQHPLYVELVDGRLYSMHGPDLPVSADPQELDEEGVVAAVRAIHYVGESTDIFLFSSKGRFFGVDWRMIPLWDNRDQRRSIRDVLFLEGDEGIRALVPRREVVTGRVIHVTAEGKGKATEGSEFGPGLDRSGREAFLVRDGDIPVAVMGGRLDDTVFCVSAMGQGIHFQSEELRSMGRKAVGVNVMKLADDADEVVAAFLGKNVRQVAVISEEGYGKRVDFKEFRTQGRGGQGMQLLRLNPGDRLAGAAPCNPAEDIVLVSSKGRVWRMAASEFLLMGRPAKGNQMIELADGERIMHLSALPCGG